MTTQSGIGQHFIQSIGIIIGLFLMQACSIEASEDYPDLEEEFNTKSEKRSITASPVEIKHYNVIVGLDLSNRISVYNKPLSDEEVVETMLDSFLEKVIFCGNRDQNQRDKFSVKIINTGLASKYDVDLDKLNIDLSSFNSQLDRINYLKNRSEKKIATDRSSFSIELGKALKAAKKNPQGCDIWKFLNEDLNHLDIKKDANETQKYGVLVKEKYENIIVIFTDGYIEAGLYGSKNCKDNECYYLSKHLIDSFRSSFKKSGYQDMRKFFTDYGYGITPVQNELLKGTKIVVFELFDRSLTPSGTPTIRPTDKEIMILFWEDWIRQSGAEPYIKPYFELKQRAREEFESIINC